MQSKESSLFNQILTYEEFEAGMTIFQVNYNFNGVIESLLIYSEFLNGLIKVDLDYFQQQQPIKYNYFQNRVNEALDNTYKEYL